ncbi:MAG: periplasmic heavy metal sensor [bacterium]|nr:periplasmic heavy metal sensor [bacterium]
MKIRTLVYLVILLLAVNVAAISTIIYYRVSAPRGEMRMPFVPGDGPPPGEMPNLSKEEMKIMIESRKQVDSMVAPFVDEMSIHRRELMDELKSDDPDTARVFQLIEKIGVLQGAIQKQMVEQFLNDRDSFRPEQRARLLKMIEERSRWQERRQMCGRKMNRDR